MLWRAQPLRRALHLRRRLAPAPSLLPACCRGPLLRCCRCVLRLLCLLRCLLRQNRQIAQAQHSVFALLHAAVQGFAKRSMEIDLRQVSQQEYSRGCKKKHCSTAIQLRCSAKNDSSVPQVGGKHNI